MDLFKWLNMILFRTKRESKIQYQKTFVNKAIEIFNPLFSKYSFELINHESNEISSRIIFKKGIKYILILAQNDYRDGSFFELLIGGSLDFETNSFDEYYISINRLYKIVRKKGVDFYPFPIGERKCSKSLEKAKKDFLKCALFYLETEEDLFDKILKLKEIRQ